MISPAPKQIPIWLFKTWNQTPQVSEVFDSSSIGICADQSSLAEKNKQVQLMAEIFKAAQGILV